MSVSVCVSFVAGTGCCPCRFREEKKKCAYTIYFRRHPRTVWNNSRKVNTCFFFSSNEMRIRRGSALALHMRALTQTCLSQKRHILLQSKYIHKAICLGPTERLLVADARLFLGGRNCPSDHLMAVRRARPTTFETKVIFFSPCSILFA